MSKEQFIQELNKSYQFKGDSLLVGSAVYGEDYETGVKVKLPLKSFNRHGLITGATGTGKTKSLQLIAEDLSNAGVPVLVMDIKGDLSGLGAEGTTNKIVKMREELIGMKWEGQAFPLEFLTISEEPGARMRATVSEYGPILLAKILDLNNTQSDVLSLLFKYCDDKALPLLDLKDLRSVLNHIREDGKEEFKRDYGYVHSSSVGAIMRSIVSLEQQDATDIFGEPSFEIYDLMKKDQAGRGKINVIRLTDMQTKPDLFSTFMLSLLAEVFEKMPEQGDADKPELVLFIDEAHLIFRNASKNLLEQLEVTIKLIRSKGVGIFFVTQSPNDIPAIILSQLGTKVQHALRAFTARDRKAIKVASENYPTTTYYKVDKLITELGIGEALISTLDEKGKPTELAHTLMRPPFSRMDVLTASEIKKILYQSELIKKYNVEIDRESAYEILQEKIELKEAEELKKKDDDKGYKKTTAKRGRKTVEKSTFDKILKSPVANTIAREITRGILGVLGLKSTTRRRRR